MGFLNMTQEQINPTMFNNSTPTFTLSPPELEGALSQYFGTMIWTGNFYTFSDPGKLITDFF
jgi:hypothetical protein